MIIGKNNYFIHSDGNNGYYVKIGTKSMDWYVLCKDGKVRKWSTMTRLFGGTDKAIEQCVWATREEAEQFVIVCLASKNHPILIPGHLQGHYRTPLDMVKALQYGLKSNTKILRHIVSRMVEQMIDDADLKDILAEEDE